MNDKTRTALTVARELLSRSATYQERHDAVRAIDKLLADRSRSAASPDVAKMVEEAKRLVSGACGSWRVARGDDTASAEDIQLRAFAAIDALGAAATQARAAVGAVEGKSDDPDTDLTAYERWHGI